MRKDRLDMDGIQDMGLRIVQAARLAVAVHLYESVARHTTPDGEEYRVARQILRRRLQQVATGGAGPSPVGPDGEQPSARLGDLVTDDEWVGLMGHDDDDASTGR
jgi:hypothetical protein